MSIGLQITRLNKKGNAENMVQGKRAIHKETGWVCTILRVQFTEVGTRYTVHFDHQANSLEQVIWGSNNIVILGEVQAGGNTKCL